MQRAGLQNFRNPASGACRQGPNFVGRKGSREKNKRKKKIKEGGKKKKREKDKKGKKEKEKKKGEKKGEKREIRKFSFLLKSFEIFGELV